jgi:hypothetical protein
LVKDCYVGYKGGLQWAFGHVIASMPPTMFDCVMSSPYCGSLLYVPLFGIPFCVSSYTFTLAQRRPFVWGDLKAGLPP